MNSTMFKSLTEASNLSGTMLKLPSELQIQAVRYIKEPKHLDNLCRTYCSLSHSVVPRPQEAVSLLVERLDERLKNSLDQENQNLKRLRYLLANEAHGPFERFIHKERLLQLLQCLPENTLQQLYMDSPSEMSSEVDRLGFQTQDKLKDASPSSTHNENAIHVYLEQDIDPYVTFSVHQNDERCQAICWPDASACQVGESSHCYHDALAVRISSKIG